ncbi:hypothetical protein [Providencia sp. Me31A]|uniref:hypothetical protein n=1 Tax=Providencia sp. Me31A TaxID=3392637 RepID=UPI003D2976F8
MELRYKLSDYNEPLLQTETSKMPLKQMEVIQFIDKIDNVNLTIGQAFYNARIMLLLPIAVTFLISFLYGVNVIYIDPWKKTEKLFLEVLENREKKDNELFFFKDKKKSPAYGSEYLDGKSLPFSSYLDYRYFSGSTIKSNKLIFDLLILLVQLLTSVVLFLWIFLMKNRPPLICDREKQLFYTWDMKMNVYVAKYTQIEFADIRPTLTLFLYRVDNQGNLATQKYLPNLTLFSYLGGGSDNDKAWGLGYITKYLFNGLTPLAEADYTRKRCRLFRDAPVPSDLEQQIKEQVTKVDKILPQDEVMEAHLAECIRQSI